jgi:hypothetical protein
MKITLQCDLGEGTFQVTTTLYSVVEWERKFKRRASEIATSGIGVEDLAYLAYVTIKLQGNVVIPPVFDDFVKRLVSIDVVDDQDSRPTEADTDTH